MNARARLLDAYRAFCLLVSILLLRTADAFRALERWVHGVTYRAYHRLVVDVGVRPRLAARVYGIDSTTRGICAAATIVAYRWCNWWRHRGVVRRETAVQPSNVKGIGVWRATKQR